MALKKQIETPFGYLAEYFRITEINQDRKQVALHIDLYKDAAARNAGKQPLIRNFIAKAFNNSLSGGGFRYTFELNDWQFENENVYDCAYAYLKTLPFFDGAVDV